MIIDLTEESKLIDLTVDDWANPAVDPIEEIEDELQYYVENHATVQVLPVLYDPKRFRVSAAKNGRCVMGDKVWNVDTWYEDEDRIKSSLYDLTLKVCGRRRICGFSRPRQLARSNKYLMQC